MDISSRYTDFISSLPKEVKLIAVSKTKSAEDIMELYKAGHRDFGENYVQELVSKVSILPKDIRWHFIGHLQSNKVKMLAPFIEMIHGCDSLKLLREINKEAIKNNRKIKCLLQLHVAQEETKFGFSEDEITSLIAQNSFSEFSNIEFCGVMGMASNTNDEMRIREDFMKISSVASLLKTNSIFNNSPIISMGMSSDYKIAIKEGSNMIRIGSLLFGERNYNK